MYAHAPIPLPKELDVWSEKCASDPVVFPDPDFTLFLLSFKTLGWVRQVPLGSKISCTRCQLATALHQLALFKLLQHKDWHTPSLHPSTFTMRKRYYFLLIKQAQTSKRPLQSLCPLTGYCKNDHRLTLTKIKSS